MEKPVLQHLSDKILPLETLSKNIARWKLLSEQLVFTNGCFDILHYGHLHYLAEAKSLGDKLIVGLNSAASVKRLKGDHRPINDELTRQYTLAALQFVDAVVVFEEDTPYQLIEIVMPDILVKGGDWAPEAIVGSDLVLKNGGKVQSLPFIEGYSTTKIEEKIRSW
ncbi:MAG: D-glycero-beta-D-manno-heptose 1-phosphate adenylyltransferase [Saprospiraceae bacterium]